MNKKIIAIIIGLVFIIAIALLGQLFNVASIEVSYNNTKSLSTDDANIIALSNITIGQNILTIDEKVAEATIEQGYGNVLKVTNIERRLPNKVVIHVETRELLFSVDGAMDTYATDQEFQINTLKKSDNTLDVDYSQLIHIKGVTIDNSFNLAELKNVRNIISGFYTLDYDNVALKKLIASIDVNGDDYTINFREYTNSSITLTANNTQLISTLSAKLNEFYELSDANRYGKTL